jgi:hypothetical protein
MMQLERLLWNSLCNVSAQTLIVQTIPMSPPGN